MTLHPGSILISSPLMEDAGFKRAVVVIVEYNEKGATGFVINKPFPRKLNELVEFINIKPFALYAGGPVDTENIFVLHRKPELIAGGSNVFGDVYMGGDFKQVTQHINNAVIGTRDIKLFIGYCGWDTDELEAEIEEGSWLVVDKNKAEVFSEEASLWEKLSQ